MKNGIWNLLKIMTIAFLMIFAGCSKDDNSSNTKVPVLKTSSVSNITDTSAICGGDIVSGGDSILARGVCWSTDNTPTIDTTGINTTKDGIGTGSFTSRLTGLAPSTTYYVRAYARNSEGIGYGSIMSFKTAAASLNPSLTFDMPKDTILQVIRGQQIVFDFLACPSIYTHSRINTIFLVASYSTGGSDTLIDTFVVPVVLCHSIQYTYDVSATAPIGQVISFSFTAVAIDNKKTIKVITLIVT